MKQERVVAPLTTEKKEKDTPWFPSPDAHMCLWKGKGPGGKRTVPLVTCRTPFLRN